MINCLIISNNNNNNNNSIKLFNAGHLCRAFSKRAMTQRKNYLFITDSFCETSVLVQMATIGMLLNHRQPKHDNPYTVTNQSNPSCGKSKLTKKIQLILAYCEGDSVVSVAITLSAVRMKTLVQRVIRLVHNIVRPNQTGFKSCS